MRKGFSPGVILGGVAVVLAMTGSAVAASAITSSQIKDGTIQSRDIRKGTIALNRLAPGVQERFAMVGQPGPKGDSGAAGPQGAKGDPGPSVFGGSPLAGAEGPAGPAGAKGDTGAAGADGAKGDAGAAGAAGAKGDTGEVGPAGAKGDAGEAGAAGAKGDTGAAGAAGAKGDTGEVGPAGAKGDNGAPGAKGDTGPAGAKGDTGADGAKGDTGPQGPAGVIAPQSMVSQPKLIEKIGGPINANQTVLGTKTLAPGTYIVTVDAAFESSVAGDPNVEVYPQVSLFVDKNHNGRLDYSNDPALNEGDISPNAIMPVAKNRHISTSGVTQITLTAADDTIGLVAFGYTSTQGNERSNEINVVRAVVGALKVG